MPSHERPEASRPQVAPALGPVFAGVPRACVPVRVAGRPAAPGARRHRLGGVSGHSPEHVRG
eukprot:9278210-Alexandrium_andersonii.AAC.1